MKSIPKTSGKRGFALIVTLSLMILLTVIAVGLLTLSSISLRVSSQGDAMAKARANARMALMLAIGELQKAAGPDKAITAPSDIVATSSKKPNLTGVWGSWDFDVKSSTLDYDSPKTQQSQTGSGSGFKGWLVSDGSLTAPKDRAYPDSDFSGESIELVGVGSLGKDAVAADKARAGKVIVRRDGKRTGNFAWHISDESVKARINTYRDASLNQTLSQRRALLAGHRPDISVMENSRKTKLGFLPDDVQDYAKAMATTTKVVSLNQAELFGNADTIKSFRNDVTPYSLGLMTNVREGGLKQDLTSLFELTTNASTGTIGLPPAYSGKKVYQTSVFSSGTAVTGVSDPYWTALAGYYNTYKELLTPDSGPKLNKAPAQDIVLTSLVQPQQYSPAPVIAKVELLFSFIVRDKHGPWKSNPGDYEGHLLYTPIFTLHNPYNVNLQFDRMKIGVADAPVGFTFYVNGVAQNKLTPLANLFTGASGKKEFWMELADWPSASATSPTGSIIMKPGQTMVFGPYINASEAFGDDNASYSDYANNKTGSESAPLKAKRGFSGANIGFDVDWLKGGILNVNKTDQIAVEVKSIAPPGAPAFNVKATLTSKGVTKSYGGMNFSYGSQAVLDQILPETLRYPKTNGIVAEVMHAANTTPNGSITQAKAFALFSAYARTSNGGVDGTGSRSTAAGSKASFPDGRLAGNPFLHNNAARVVISSDLTREKPAMQSHELNLVTLNGSSDDAFSIASDFRTNYLLNYKQVSGKSIKSGSYLEIPSGPLQAIADFRRSNVLASPYLPAFVQPIGNSYASPMISTNKVIEPGGVTSSYALLDHSVLANHALYDGSYFSTFAPAGAQSAVDGFNNFMNDNKALRSQLFQAYLPVGRTVADAKSDLFAGSGKPTASAYKIAAQYQMVKGPFNVNSTRVQAWKAVLSSMNHSDLLTLWAKSGVLDKKQNGGVPIPAMTLHNGSATNGTFAVGNIDDKAGNEWNGYREFSDADIERLAIEIVKQVRLRGPFLSMSEFVNRRLGSDSDLSRTGALQNAIDESHLNDSVYTAQIPVAESNVSDAKLYGFKTPKAATGNPAAGAPGWLSQADILKLLEPAATVRSDTFVIRSCGEATDAAGNIVARAYAEAVVQRFPEYVNPSDPVTARVPNPNYPGGTADPVTPMLVAPENIAFGRRFVMVSFKWLSPNEI
ncbi:MAG: hypothetical protein ABIS50_14175 [Luteolibacter sp.]|uniref:hypothetical protein n=1 Tax=Luteolibacter sp. TaxID=1962973 RepID=UPI0032674F07